MSQENNWEKEFEDFCSKNTVKLAGYGDHFAIQKNSIKTFVSQTLETERLRIEKEVSVCFSRSPLMIGKRTPEADEFYLEVLSIIRPKI